MKCSFPSESTTGTACTFPEQPTEHVVSARRVPHRPDSRRKFDFDALAVHYGNIIIALLVRSVGGKRGR
jgi:hypothetical protein